MLEVLKLRYAVAGAHALYALREEDSAFRHFRETVIVVDMLALDVKIVVRRRDALFRLWKSIGNALGTKRSAEVAEAELERHHAHLGGPSSIK